MFMNKWYRSFTVINYVVIYEQETYSKTSVPDYKKITDIHKNNVRLVLVNFRFLYKNFKTY